MLLGKNYKNWNCWFCSKCRYSNRTHVIYFSLRFKFKSTICVIIRQMHWTALKTIRHFEHVNPDPVDQADRPSNHLLSSSRIWFAPLDTVARCQAWKIEQLHIFAKIFLWLISHFWEASGSAGLVDPLTLTSLAAWALKCSGAIIFFICNVTGFMLVFISYLCSSWQSRSSFGC